MKRKAFYSCSTKVLAGAIAIALSPGAHAMSSAARGGSIHESTTNGSVRLPRDAKRDGPHRSKKMSHGGGVNSVPARLAQTSSYQAPATASTSESNPTKLSEIVVTGLRASLQSAAERKRDAPQIMDSIVAQSIGKLPDVTAAESLGRITGVQVAQDAATGEGQTIAIRGLTQVETLLNGIPAFTAGSRTLNLEDIPAGILSSIDVYKTPLADQVEGGIGGTVNIHTFMPLDFKGFKASAQVGANNASIAARTKPLFSGLISNNWNTSVGRFGALLAVSYRKRAFGHRLYEPDPPQTTTVNNDGTSNAQEILTYPSGSYTEFSRGTIKRIGINAALQWKPTDNLDIYLRSFVSKYDQYNTALAEYVDASLPAKSNIGTVNKGQSTLQKFTTYPGTHDLNTGDFSNANLFPLEYFGLNQDKSYNFTLGGKWTSSPLSISASAHFEHGTSNNETDELGFNGHVPEYSLDTTPTRLKTSFGNFDLTNPANFTFDNAQYGFNRNRSKSRSVRADGIYLTNFDFLNTVKFGLRSSDRRARQLSNNVYVAGSAPFGQPVSTIPALINVIPSAYSNRPVLDPNNDIVRHPALLWNTLGLGTLPGPNPAQTFSLHERTSAGYAEGIFNTNGDMPVSGNVGVRFVRTRDSLQGALSNAGTVTPVSKSNSYFDILPSFNIKVNLTDALQWRVAGSETMSRPTFGQIAPAVSLNPIQGTGTSGNSSLKPMKAAGYDTSLGWFFGQGNYISADAFYKTIKDPVVTKIVTQTFNNTAYFIQTPENGTSGNLRGAELGYQQFFRALPGWLSGLGVKANYTYVHSGLKGVLPDFKTPLPGLSRNSYNLILLYDQSDFFARIAYNWRSSFFVTTRASGLGTVPIIQRPTRTLDASIGYNFNQHLTVSLDGKNLTDAVNETYYLRPTLRNKIYFHDRVVELSARLNF